MLFKGWVEGGLYPLRVNPTSFFVVTLQATKVSSAVWHACLGHPNSRTLKHILPCLPTLNKNFNFCESCTLGKSTKLSFSTRSAHAQSFLHTLHMDVRGPAPIPPLMVFAFIW